MLPFHGCWDSTKCQEQMARGSKAFPHQGGATFLSYWESGDGQAPPSFLPFCEKRNMSDLRGLSTLILLLFSFMLRVWGLGLGLEFSAFDACLSVLCHHDPVAGTPSGLPITSSLES